MGHNEGSWTVFWCSLLGPIQLDEITAGERKRFPRELGQQEVRLPNGNRKRLSYSTLQRKVCRSRQERIRGLQWRPRNDQGQSRQGRKELLARAVELKRQQPLRAPKVINEFLKQESGQTLSRSTMNRHLRQQGATRRKLGVTPTKIRCRGTREQSNASWVGDFSEDPRVLHEVFLGIGKRYERKRGPHEQPAPTPALTPLDHAYLKMLKIGRHPGRDIGRVNVLDQLEHTTETAQADAIVVKKLDVHIIDDARLTM